MAFDADKWMEALERPVFRSHGKEWVGAIVSFEEWVALEPRLRAFQSADTNYVQTRRLIRDLTDLVFPRAWWKVWEKRASHYVLRLPLAAQMDAVRDFIESQGMAMGMTAPAPTPGNSSQPGASAAPRKKRQPKAQSQPVI